MPVILAQLDKQGKEWYLHREASLGNLMKTPDPLAARTWPNALELRLWAESLSPGSKAQLAGRPLLVVPVVVHVGEPEATFMLEVVPVLESATPDPVPSYQINTATLPTPRRGRKVEKSNDAPTLLPV